MQEGLNMRVAIGLKARTGRAALVVLAADANGPRLIERVEIPLLPKGDWAPYHAAEGLEPKEARQSVERSIAAAHRLATSGIRDAVQRSTKAGHEVRGCGVLVGTGMPEWTTDDILAVHVRMHKAEGELFRDVLVAGARECGLEVTTLPGKTALDAAAAILRMNRARLDATIAGLGKAAGAPWGKDQKEAAAAALAALNS
jgi:hypothetical protein